MEGRPARCPLLWLGVFGNGEYQNTRWERLGRTDLGWLGRGEFVQRCVGRSQHKEYLGFTRDGSVG